MKERRRIEMRKLNKDERKVLIGMVGKLLKFAGTLSPEEISLLSRILVGLSKSTIEIDED